METQNLIPNTPEWHAYRSVMRNASDAPAMMGCSPYETRTQLMHRLHTGITPEVDAATQRRFDEGHRFEALARPLAEEIIGEGLGPVVGSLEGTKLSASFDGLTFMGDVNWEHKRMNAALRAVMVDGCTGSDLPLMYRVQVEQQHIVAGVAEKTLFMASEWDDNGNLIEERHCWYMPDAEFAAQIIAGWGQFEIDLAAYVPPEVIIPAVAAPQMGLPAVSIQVNGSIALVDNLQAFGTALTAYVERINKEPETDQDFADLEATVKTLKAAEEALEAAENGALAQTDSIDAMRRTVGLYRDTARTNRLLVEKLVKVEKENRRTKIVGDAVAELVSHVKKLNDRLGKPYMPAIAGDFQGVVKGLKSIDSMRDKVAGELARCKIAANEAADRIQANLATLRELATEHAFLFADTAQIVLKANDDLTALVKSRIADHKAAESAKEEATRERIRAEEQEKAEKAVREAQEAEDALVSSFESNARRIEHDSVPYIEKALTAYKSTAKDWANDPRPRIATAYAAGLKYLLGQLDAAQQREAAAQASADAIAKAQPEPAAIETAAPAKPDMVRFGSILIPREQIDKTWPAKSAPATPPDLKLGQIAERLGFALTADFLKSLGFEPAATDKSAKLYHSKDFPAICRALIEHIESVCEMQEA